MAHAWSLNDSISFHLASIAIVLTPVYWNSFSPLKFPNDVAQNNVVSKFLEAVKKDNYPWLYHRFKVCMDLFWFGSVSNTFNLANMPDLKWDASLIILKNKSIMDSITVTVEIWHVLLDVIYSPPHCKSYCIYLLLSWFIPNFSLLDK